MTNGLDACQRTDIHDIHLAFYEIRYVEFLPRRFMFILSLRMLFAQEVDLSSVHVHYSENTNKQLIVC